MSFLVRQEKLRNAFSRTALGSEMSRKEVDWAWSLMKEPEGRSVESIWTRSPGSRVRVCIIYRAFVSRVAYEPGSALAQTQNGRYIFPSSAMNSNTPACVIFSATPLISSKSMGYVM